MTRPHLSPRNRCLLAAATLSAALCSGCGAGEPIIGHLDTILRDDGTLHILSRSYSNYGLGNEYTNGDFLYAGGAHGDWHRSSSVLGEDEVSDGVETPYQLVFDAANHPVLVADVAGGLAVQALDGDEWKTLAVGPKISADAAEMLGRAHELGAVWRGTDKNIRVLYGSWIYVVSGDEISDATYTGGSCRLMGGCAFDPTGDLAGEAAAYNPDTGRYTLRQLDCTGSHCQWTEVAGVDLGARDQGEPSRYLRRVFFHTKDGKGILVRPVRATGTAQGLAVSANTRDHEITVISGGASAVGAGPRPGGGFAVAVLTDTGRLRLFVYDEDDQVKEHDLGNFDGDGEDIGVHVSDATGVEEVHIVLPKSNTAVMQFVVDIAAGTAMDETIEMR